MAENAIPQMVVTSEKINRLCYINDKPIALPTEEITQKEYFEEIADEFGLEENRAFRIHKELIQYW